MTNPSADVRIAVLETRQEAFEDWRTETNKLLRTLVEVQQAMARIEGQGSLTAQQLGEALSQFRALDARVSHIEQKLPGLEEARGGLKEVVKYVLVAVGAALLALIGLKHGG